MPSQSFSYRLASLHCSRFRAGPFPRMTDPIKSAAAPRLVRPAMKTHICLLLTLPMITLGGQPTPPSAADTSQPIPDHLRIPDAPPTVRVLAPFQRIRPGMSMLDVVMFCGFPDEHQGSGLFIFIYRLQDGSVVTIGTSDLKQIMYVNHTSVTGKVTPLIPSK